GLLFVRGRAPRSGGSFSVPDAEVPATGSIAGLPELGADGWLPGRRHAYQASFSMTFIAVEGSGTTGQATGFGLTARLETTVVAATARQRVVQFRLADLDTAPRGSGASPPVRVAFISGAALPFLALIDDDGSARGFRFAPTVDAETRAVLKELVAA